MAAMVRDLGCAADSEAQADGFSPPVRLTEPRLAPFSEDELTREHLMAMGTDPDNPDVRPRMNLFRTMLHNAELMDHWRHFGDYVNAGRKRQRSDQQYNRELTRRSSVSAISG